MTHRLLCPEEEGRKRQVGLSVEQSSLAHVPQVSWRDGCPHWVKEKQPVS